MQIVLQTQYVPMNNISGAKDTLLKVTGCSLETYMGVHPLLCRSFVFGEPQVCVCVPLVAEFSCPLRKEGRRVGFGLWRGGTSYLCIKSALVLFSLAWDN